ncbi:cholesteryl ester transfer protein [Acipenser oxyrinchus oxyrinchus]|uniref:Cholesteryl ester transfer protein n=1 Tax=Acipenser oxyrinchus oxyrinchus TaxID=40147 RepID=A0AAD8G1Q6_ACIOX|nr:cholesteryl ester transfer protein [Acipenser oxyrinchus oxyrinchus]
MFPTLVLMVLLCLAAGSLACDSGDSPFKSTGIACRVTKPAALVLNQKTTQVIQAAFKHAKYPSMKGEKSILFIGKVLYGLNNLEIHNLSIGKSEVELRENDAIGIEIHNVSATFKGALHYGYGSWLINLGHSVDFEIESHIDLRVNTKLYCGKGRVTADTSDCTLTFHKLLLHLQGDKQPGWMKKLFTDFISFTVKLVIKSQICKEINTVANIMADFIQERAELFLSDGDIGVDISLTTSPSMRASYIESHHKGLVLYRKVPSSFLNESVFSPALLSESRMLYFWISDQVLNPMVKAAHQDHRFIRHIAGDELKELFQVDLSRTMPDILNQIISSENPVAKMWSLAAPELSMVPQGTIVKSAAAVELRINSSDAESPSLYIEMDVEVAVQASYANKKLFLDANPISISIRKVSDSAGMDLDTDSDMDYFKEMVHRIGIPKVISYLEPGLTSLMDSNDLNLFEIINPEIITQEGYVVIQLDFGFPHHLLVDFLKKNF